MLELFKETAKELTEQGLYGLGFKNARLAEKDIRARISAFPEGQDLLAYLEQNNISLNFDKNHPHQASVETCIETGKMHSIDFRLIRNTDALIGTLFHEARHVMKDIEGFKLCVPRAPREGARELSFQQKEELNLALWNNRVLEADAETYSIHMCDLMAQAGDPAPLKDKTTNGFSKEMTAAYLTSKEKGLPPNQCLKDCFDAWFTAKKCNTYDNLVKKIFLTLTKDTWNALAKKEGLIHPKAITKELLGSALTINNKNYFTETTPLSELKSDHYTGAKRDTIDYSVLDSSPSLREFPLEMFRNVFSPT